MSYLLCVASLALAADPSVKIEKTDNALTVRVTAVLSDEVAKKTPAGTLTQEQGEARLMFALVDEKSGKAGDSMFGRYEHDKGKLIFTPRHGLLAGQRYRATLIDTKKNLTTDYDTPAKKVEEAPRVVKVYPTADVLPANQLKFYIYFSRPMRETRTIFDHFQILDDKGKPIDDPWRRTELWSNDGKRLTLWIHPGRIKKGVNLREEIGPVLEPDRSYTLEIGGKILDGEGVELGKSFTKKFRTKKMDRSFVLVEDWKVDAPKQGTRAALTLTFPRPLDHALLQRFVTVLDKDKKPVSGKIEVGKEERSLTFTPSVDWKDQDYQVVVDPRLEDLAGNTPEQLFDVDNTEDTSPKKPQKVTFRPTKE